MNNRIREILDDAEVIWDKPDAHNPLALVSLEEFKEILETVVKECVYEIKMTMVRDGYDTKHYLQSRKHIEHICKHFGVKE